MKTEKSPVGRKSLLGLICFYVTDAINSGNSIEIKTMESKVGATVSKSICPNPIGIVGGGISDYSSYVSISTYGKKF